MDYIGLPKPGHNEHGQVFDFIELVSPSRLLIASECLDILTCMERAFLGLFKCL